MQVKEDTTLSTMGGESAELLARKLSDAVKVVANVNGGRNGGNGDPIGKERARRIAGDVGAAILANANARTAEHSDDVVLITEAIGLRMGIDGDDAGDLLAAARLHDIGKAWIPATLLEKPGPLSADEWEIMYQHTLVGERILSSVEELQEVARLVRHSHERWDGKGYPDGLGGSEIPLGSRIIFCADAFHAIRCDRPYRAGRSAREAVAEINRCAGTQFDPRVAGALEQVVHERSRRPRGMGGSTRLLALLMCLALGGAGSAIARSGWLQEPAVSASQSSSPPPACGPAGCPSVAGPTTQEAGAIAAPVLPPGLRAVTAGAAAKHHKVHLFKAKTSSARGKGNGNGKQGKGHGKGHSAHASSAHGNSSGSSSSASTSSYTGSSGGSAGSGGGHGYGHSSSRGHSSHSHRGSSSTGSSHGNAFGHSK